MAPAGSDSNHGVNNCITGTNENMVWRGSGVPSVGLGANGDFYINTAANTIYGPKTAGVWGSATSLVGPTGATGATGAQGNTGPAGPTTVTRVTGTSADSANHPSVGTIVGPVTASCSGGKTLVGGGLQIISSGATKGATLDSFPSTAGTNGTWTADGVSVAGGSGNFTVTPYALCGG